MHFYNFYVLSIHVKTLCDKLNYARDVYIAMCEFIYDDNTHFEF